MSDDVKCEGYTEPKVTDIEAAANALRDLAEYAMDERIRLDAAQSLANLALAILREAK